MKKVFLMIVITVLCVGFVFAIDEFKEKETKDFIKNLDKANKTDIEKVKILDVCEENGLIGIQTDSFLMITAINLIEDVGINNKDCSKTLKIKSY